MSKLLIVSLDGASWTVIKPLVEQGLMPNLARVMEAGSWGELESVIPPVTAPAWVSFMTGKKPDKHGIFDFLAFDPSTLKRSLTNASCILGETIWDILSRHGKSVATINLPYTYPPSPVNGVMISGIDAPSTESEWCYPATLKEELRQKFPDYAPAMEPWSMDKVATKKRAMCYVEQLSEFAALRTQVALYLIDRSAPDVAMVHFQESDYLQHVLWDRVSQAASDPSRAGGLDKTLRRFYSRLDDYIGELWEAASATSSDCADIMVISDHGFTTHRGTVFPNALLRSAGWAHFHDGGRPGLGSRLKAFLLGSRSPLVRKLAGALWLLRVTLSPRHAPTLSKDLEGAAQVELACWASSRAAMVTGSANGFVHVRSQEDIPACLALLRDARCPRTGAHLFQRVGTMEETYGRPANEHFGRFILLTPLEGWDVSVGLTPYQLRARGPGDCEGVHAPQGIFAAAGPGLRKAGQISLKLVDVSPTVLNLLDLPVPADMDGKAQTDILKNERPPRFEEPTRPVSREKRQLGCGAEEDGIIKERLRSLGYL